MLTVSVLHKDNQRLFVFSEDYMNVARKFCNQKGRPEHVAYPFAAMLQVFETWRDDRLKSLEHMGITDATITPEMLWIDCEWSQVAEQAMHIFGSRTFQSTLRHVIEAGFARHRYIKRGHDGKPLIYTTYKAALRDKAHGGEVTHQVYFENTA